MPSVGPQDELTAAVFNAVESLRPLQKARFLLDHVLRLIECGK